MDFWTRLFGASYAPRKPPVVKPVVDSQTRFQRFQAALTDVERICSNKRDLAREEHTLGELQKLFDKLAQIIREETRASIPHPCVAWALKNQVFATVNRAAAVSFHEGCIHAAIALMAALVDSEEESFLTNTSFAKSLMRLVTRVVNAGDVLLSIEAETFILELLFTISAKIRLQPEILPSWFTPTRRSEEQSVHTKDDFLLCYILVDRIYHDGRIGDFARTGLLYIFEATGKSKALEQWIVESSDVCTLMASGLGALYSQLSRELSILYPDAVLPATLALSDYTTIHSQATAASAFSDDHISHMKTFLSYLAFWQDILDHCKSDEVRQSLLDHFQVLFLQQLLYPSILESSDTDGGSSVAVLSYLCAILESLEHPVLTESIMSYLLAVNDNDSVTTQHESKRHSLLELSVASGLDQALQPTLFNLVDLLRNSLASKNPQTLFSALRLTSTIITRQCGHAFSSMLKIDPSSASLPKRTLGSVQVEVDRHTSLARRIHDHGVETAFVGLVEDLQSSFEENTPIFGLEGGSVLTQYCLSIDDAFLQQLLRLLRNFFTNSIDVNLALTECFKAVACCSEVRLEGLLCPRDSHSLPQADTTITHVWQQYLDDEEQSACATVLQTIQPPAWPHKPPILFAILEDLVAELDGIRKNVSGLDALISGRKNLLQAASIDATIDVPSVQSSPIGLRSQKQLSSRANSPSPAPRSQNTDESMLAATRAAMPTRPIDGTAAVSEARHLLRPAIETPPTTDNLMKTLEFIGHHDQNADDVAKRTASLNHVLTNTIVLQEFILELVAILTIRASVLGDAEVTLC